MLRKVAKQLKLSMILVLTMSTVVFASENHSQILSSGTSYSDTHSNSWNLVNSSTEVRWSGESYYSDNLSMAMGNWNYEGKVQFKADTWYTSNNLTISDINESEVGYDGIAYSSGSISFNRHYLDEDNYTASNILGVMMHELGHAIGIGDHYSYTNRDKAVMGGWTFNSDGTSCRALYITTHDKEDETSIWP